MGSKQTGTTTSTQNTTPWGPQQPYLEDIFSNAQGLYQGAPPQYYPGTTYAPETWPQQSGLDWMVSAATSGSQYPWEALDTSQRLMSGEYLNANPALGLFGDFAGNNAADTADSNSALEAYARGDYLSQDNPYTDDLVKSITSRVLPGIQSQFIQGGMLSSPEAARASTEGVGAAVAPELFKRQQQEEENQMAAANALANRYMQGRGLQQQAAGGLGQTYAGGVDDIIQGLQLSPQTYQQLFAPGQAVFGTGSAQQQLDQQQINDAVARWNFEQSQPWDLLNQYIGQVTGNYGGTTTLNQPFFTNPTQNALGTATAAAGLIGKL